MNIDRYGHLFLNRGLLCPARPKVPQLPAKKPVPANGDTSGKTLKFRTIPPNNHSTKDWTASGWPTNIQSATPDGKFGPAKQRAGWGDCWFMAPLSAVANDPDGHKILAESIRKVKAGYQVTFKGLPYNNVFISNAELKKFLKTEGGDADTRLMELAADKIFNKRGSFKSLYITAFMSAGMNEEQANHCLQKFCSGPKKIQDQMTHNPMRGDGSEAIAFFMFTGLFPDILFASSAITLQSSEILAYLNRYLFNDRDGASVVFGTTKNPLGESVASHQLVIDWDVIRTEITSTRSSNSRLSKEQQAFLKALDKWLETGMSYDLKVLKSAARNLKLNHFNPADFVVMLSQNLFSMNPEHVDLLRSGVREVLDGGPGFIGLTGHHVGTIEGIDKAAGTFTYCEPNYPDLVHNGELSYLIQAVRSGDVPLLTVDTASGRDDNARQRFEDAGTGRGRRLRQLHNQVVRDGTIDQAESSSLADLMAMDDDSFRQVYDSDKNGVIEGHELKAVQLRLDRRVEYLALTPIW